MSLINHTMYIKGIAIKYQSDTKDLNINLEKQSCIFVQTVSIKLSKINPEYKL